MSDSVEELRELQSRPGRKMDFRATKRTASPKMGGIKYEFRGKLGSRGRRSLIFIDH